MIKQIRYQNSYKQLSFISSFCLMYKIIKMEQTLSFLSVIDKKIKRSHNHKLQSLSTKQKTHHKNHSHRYPYAKALNFTQSKYDDFPKWLREKQGFVDFMYRNYEKKLMSIPKICQKQLRTSDQKYFVSLYLSQISTFRDIPEIVKNIVLENLKTRYYPAGAIVHDDNNYAEFIGIIYLGEVEYRNGKRTIVKQKNDIIMLQAFHSQIHPQIICNEETVILALNKSVYPLLKTKLREYIEEHQRDLVDDFQKSTFFTQLHIKDEKAKTFYNNLQLQFYFPEEVIEQASNNPSKFYLIFKGQLKEDNHIFVKEHNKWPLSNTKWEVRAVYNSYNKCGILEKYKFFADEQILDNIKLKSKFSAKTFAILFTMKPNKFIEHLSSEDLKRLKKYRTEHIEIDYNELEDKVREKVKSNTQRKKIVLKAINTVLVSKSQFSPKKLKLIKDFESSMLHKPLFNQSSII